VAARSRDAQGLSRDVAEIVQQAPA